MSIPAFQKMILAWYAQNKRDYLPWRKQEALGDPYKILVSEIMLQQTRVSRVLEKYPQFLSSFPSFQDLADAPFSRILMAWQGMGYNRRARSLQLTARLLADAHKGNMPSDVRALMEFPGIGPYTAGAVACFAFNKPVVFLDTNIRKVYAHHFFSEQESKVSDSELLKVAAAMLYRKNPRLWHYALMDYGALVLSKAPLLLQKIQVYRKQPPFAGSTRYFRSKIVRHLLTKKQASANIIARRLVRDRFFSPTINIPLILSGLERDGIIQRNKNYYFKIKEYHGAPACRQTGKPMGKFL